MRPCGVSWLWGPAARLSTAVLGAVMPCCAPCGGCPSNHSAPGSGCPSQVGAWPAHQHGLGCHARGPELGRRPPEALRPPPAHLCVPPRRLLATSPPAAKQSASNSRHTPTAGTEASGTSTIKLAMDAQQPSSKPPQHTHRRHRGLRHLHHKACDGRPTAVKQTTTTHPPQAPRPRAPPP